MGRKRKAITDDHHSQSKLLPPCRVCSGPAGGLHYGVNTCDACKGFFHRSLKNLTSYSCENSDRCSVDYKQQKICPKCRYRKCIEVGMAKHAIKTGRYSMRKRAQDVQELINSGIVPACQGHSKHPPPMWRCETVGHSSLDDSFYSQWLDKSQLSIPVNQQAVAGTSHLHHQLYKQCIDVSTPSCQSSFSPSQSSYCHLSPYINPLSQPSHSDSARSGFTWRTSAERSSELATLDTYISTLNNTINCSSSSPASLADHYVSQVLWKPSVTSLPGDHASPDRSSYIHWPSKDVHDTTVLDSPYVSVSNNHIETNRSQNGHDFLPLTPVYTKHTRAESPAESQRPDTTTHAAEQSASFSSSPQQANCRLDQLSPSTDGLTDSSAFSCDKRSFSAPSHDVSGDILDATSHVRSLYKDKTQVVKVIREAMESHMRKVVPQVDRGALEQLAKEHAVTCRLKKEMFGSMLRLPDQEYDAIYAATGLDVDCRQQRATNFLSSMERHTRAQTQFAMSIPGFSLLDMKEQVRLIKGSLYEVFRILSYHSVEAKTGIKLQTNGRMYCLEESFSHSDADILHKKAYFALCREMWDLNLTMEEEAVLTASIIMSPDRPKSNHCPTVRCIYEELNQLLKDLFSERCKHPLLMYAHLRDILVGWRVFAQEGVKSLKRIRLDKYSDLLQNQLMLEMLRGIFLEEDLEEDMHEKDDDNDDNLGSSVLYMELLTAASGGS